MFSQIAQGVAQLKSESIGGSEFLIWLRRNICFENEIFFFFLKQ